VGEVVVVVNAVAGVVSVTRGDGELVEVELHPEIRTTAMMHKIRIPGTIQTAIIFVLIFSPSFFELVRAPWFRAFHPEIIPENPYTPRLFLS
jgi:hypothetical protein